MTRAIFFLGLLGLAFDLGYARPIEVIVYSKTSWYRHPEIARINGYLATLGAKHDINVSITESANELSARNLKNYDLILFNNATNLGKASRSRSESP